MSAPLFDPSVVDRALGLLLDSVEIGDALDEVVMRRIERQTKPTPEELEEDGRWWEVRTTALNELLVAMRRLNNEPGSVLRRREKNREAMRRRRQDPAVREREREENRQRMRAKRARAKE